MTVWRNAKRMPSASNSRTSSFTSKTEASGTSSTPSSGRADASPGFVAEATVCPSYPRVKSVSRQRFRQEMHHKGTATPTTMAPTRRTSCQNGSFGSIDRHKPSCISEPCPVRTSLTPATTHSVTRNATSGIRANALHVVELAVSFISISLLSTFTTRTPLDGIIA